jgi:hypothetical protein
MSQTSSLQRARRSDNTPSVVSAIIIADECGPESPHYNFTPQLSDEDDFWNLDCPLSQEDFDNPFEPLDFVPDGIEWGSSAKGGVDIDDQARRHIYKWIRYDIDLAYKQHEPINLFDFMHAVSRTFRPKLKCCNGVWYAFVGPNWREFKLKKISQRIISMVRMKFYRSAVAPVLKYLHTLKDPVIDKICKHKAALFKSGDLKNYIDEVETYFEEPDEWESLLGANLHLLGLKCGAAYNTISHEWSVGKFFNYSLIFCV